MNNIAILRPSRQGWSGHVLGQEQMRVNTRSRGRVALWLVFALLPFDASAQEPVAPWSELQSRVESGRALGSMHAAAMPLHAHQALSAFYELRGYGPAWVGSGSKRKLARDLISAVREASDHGLTPSEYNTDLLGALAPSEANALDGPALDRELLLTNAFLMYGSHLLHGRVNPETLDAEWTANRRQTDMAAVLEGALASGDIAGTLERLAPRQPRYRSLRAHYVRLRALSEQVVVPISPGPAIKEGDSGPRVLEVAARLEQIGDLPRSLSGDTFTPALRAAVERFQRRWGLEADGVVGSGTLAILNKTDFDKAEQIRANLERWRWLPDTLGRRHIEVNIADFHVDVVESGIPVMKLRSIVGRNYRETPMFSGLIRYLVLSPYWHVPPSIAVRDKLPEIKKNPGYLATQHITLIDQVTNQAVDPSSVSWGALTGQQFNKRFRLRQDPGPWNALGRVKFMFPNRHNVYLHDTPSRDLFARSVRAFSSGCIRLENPLALAQYLLRDQPKWSSAAIEAAANSFEEKTIHLTQPVPVHLLYWTAWMDEAGELQLRPDLYGRDAKVLEALNQPPPGA